MGLLPDFKDVSPFITWPFIAGILYAVGRGGYYLWGVIADARTNKRVANEAKRKEIDSEIENKTSGIREQAASWKETAQALQTRLNVVEAARGELLKEKERLEEKIKEVSEFNFTLQGDLDRLRRRVLDIENHDDWRHKSQDR